MSLVAAVSGVAMSAVRLLAVTHLDVLRAEARGGAGPQQPRGAGGELVHGREAVDGLLALLAGHVAVLLDVVWMLGAAGRECEES